METDYRVSIARPVDEVFAVLAAVQRYDEWLPPSAGYERTSLVGDKPISENSEYIDHQKSRPDMRGVVHIYDPPNRIGFRQQLKVLGVTVTVRMEYTLVANSDGTDVLRHHVMKTPLLLRVVELFIRKNGARREPKNRRGPEGGTRIEVNRGVSSRPRVRAGER